VVELIRALREKGIKSHMVIVLQEPLRDDQEEPSAEAIAQAELAQLLFDEAEVPRIGYGNGTVELPDMNFLRTRVLVRNHIASSRRFRKLRFRK
jgi:hypothetical protein